MHSAGRTTSLISLPECTDGRKVKRRLVVASDESFAANAAPSSSLLASSFHAKKENEAKTSRCRRNSSCDLAASSAASITIRSRQSSLLPCRRRSRRIARSFLSSPLTKKRILSRRKSSDLRADHRPTFEITRSDDESRHERQRSPAFVNGSNYNPTFYSRILRRSSALTGSCQRMPPRATTQSQFPLLIPFVLVVDHESGLKSTDRYVFDTFLYFQKLGTLLTP